MWVVRRRQPPCLTCLETCHGDMLGLDKHCEWSVRPDKGRVERALPGRAVSCSSPHARRAASLAPPWLRPARSEVRLSCS